VLDFFRNLISANTIIVQFIYGLAFFVLGLAIALESLHSSRLELVRSLTWLSAFGFVHAFVEWGDLFIPLQAAYLSPRFINALQHLHLLLLGISFACLFEFGVVLLQQPERPGCLHGISAAIFSVGSPALTLQGRPTLVWAGQVTLFGAEAPGIAAVTAPWKPKTLALLWVGMPVRAFGCPYLQKLCPCRRRWQRFRPDLTQFAYEPWVLRPAAAFRFPVRSGLQHNCKRPDPQQGVKRCNMLFAGRGAGRRPRPLR
jgi:hypothetical protein